MKKNILILSLFILLQNIVLATDYSQYCPVNSVQKSLGGNLASLSGFNFLVRKIVELQVQNAIKKETGSKVDVELKTFFATNALSGEFASAAVKADEFNHNGLSFSNLFVKTLCPYNFVDIKDNKITLKDNIVLKYSTELTQENINKFVSSSKFQKVINEMNANKNISKLIKIQNSNVQIKDNKLKFVYKIVPIAKNDSLFSFVNSFLKPFDIAFDAGLEVKEGKISLCDFKVNNLSSNYSYLLPIVNLFNPFNYKIDLTKNSNAKINVENVKIVDSKININGFVVLQKN